MADPQRTRVDQSHCEKCGLDPGGNGVIDASSPIFNKLVVWEDLNGDGVCQPDEVFTLSQLGIVSISLSTVAVDIPDNGSTILETATATMQDGTTREIAQVALDTNPTDTEYVGPIQVTAAAAALPQLQGYGTLMDLQHAMSVDPTLLSDVQTLLTINPSSTYDFDLAVKTVLYRWAGVDGVAANSRGPVFNGQVLGFLENMTGESYIDAHGSAYPENAVYQDNPLGQSWNIAFSGLEARLLVQDPGSIMSADFCVDQDLDYIIPDSDFVSTINDIAAQAPEAGDASLPFWINALTVLSESISDVQQIIPLDSTAIIAALTAEAPSIFSQSLLVAVANGQMTYVDASYVGAGSPDGTIVYVTSDDLVYVTAPNMTINTDGYGNEFIVPAAQGITTIDATQK